RSEDLDGEVVEPDEPTRVEVGDHEADAARLRRGTAPGDEGVGEQDRDGPVGVGPGGLGLAGKPLLPGDPVAYQPGGEVATTSPDDPAPSPTRPGADRGVGERERGGVQDVLDKNLAERADGLVEVDQLASLDLVGPDRLDGDDLTVPLGREDR